MKYTEDYLKLELWRWRLRAAHKYICPNTYAFGYESDLFSIKNNLSYSYEIKISRSDFKKEFSNTSRSKYLRHLNMRRAYSNNGGKTFSNVPNYFLFVCPADLIKANEIPEYAGLIYHVGGLEIFKTIRRCKKLHSTRVPDKIKNKVADSLMYRHWQSIDRT